MECGGGSEGCLLLRAIASHTSEGSVCYNAWEGMGEEGGGNDNLRRRAQWGSPMPPGYRRRSIDGQPKKCTSFQGVEGMTVPTAQIDHSHKPNNETSQKEAGL